MELQEVDMMPILTHFFRIFFFFFVAKLFFGLTLFLWMTATNLSYLLHRVKNNKYVFGMSIMPFLCRGVWFLPKLSHHRNVSLSVYLPIFYFSFCQKTSLHLYKRARLSSSLLMLNLCSAIPCNVIIACYSIRDSFDISF